MDGMGDDKELLATEEMRQRLITTKANRAMAAAQGKKLLNQQLDSLDSASVEVIERWSSTNDFAKVDLVCGELLKQGLFTDALKYMDRVRGLCDLVCAKLRRKINEGARDEEEEATAQELD